MMTVLLLSLGYVGAKNTTHSLLGGISGCCKDVLLSSKALRTQDVLWCSKPAATKYALH